MIEFYRDEFLLLKARSEETVGDSDVLLSFTGVGHAMGGIDVQKEEFFGAGRSFSNVIFISDLTRSWGNSIDFELLREKITPYIEGRKVYCIGNSMGGFLAVLCSQFIDCEVVLSFVPQFSVSPRIVPQETRWAQYRDRITDYVYESLEGSFGDHTEYYVIFGGKGPDRRHWKKFPAKPNVHNLILDGLDHGVAAHLKEADCLSQIIQKAFDKTLDAEYLSGVQSCSVQRVFNTAH